MKKRFVLLVSALVCMLALCSCGTKSQEEEFNGYTTSDFQMSCEQTAEVLEQLTQQDAISYIDYYSAQEGGEVYVELMEQWVEVQPELGNFLGYKDFEVTKAGKTITATLTVAHETRDYTLTYVINANSMELTAVNVQLVYSLGETMQKAGLNTLMGISIVFMILVLICLIIYCFNIIPVIQDMFSKKEEPVKDSAPVVAVSNDQPTEADDLELIAVIAAAIAMQTGASTDDFVVRSIKRRY